MGWTDDDGKHEGYAAYRTRGGATTGTSSSAGVHVRRPDADDRAATAWAAGRPPENDEIYELVAWDEVPGWQALCECGWSGQRWSADGAIWEGPYRDPDAALLSNGQTVEEAAHAAWSKHLAPVHDLAAIETAAEQVNIARRALDDAVAAARSASPPASWADIGRAAGMSRQSAHERWA